MHSEAETEKRRIQSFLRRGSLGGSLSSSLAELLYWKPSPRAYTEPVHPLHEWSCDSVHY